jgi:ABC-type sugar transport system ATPase subunit
MEVAEKPLLQLTGISKTFPGVRALEAIDFELRAGEIHALMGENGAGKSTFVKILSGVYLPDEGEIALEGRPIAITDPKRARELGISPVHQEPQLEPYLTVAENIFLGRQPIGRFGLVDYSAMNRDAARLLGDLGAEVDPNRLVGSISTAHRQIVAIARAISCRCRVIIFDEPTSSLTERETARLFESIRRLSAQNIGVIYISHRMEEVFRLCDRVSVLRDGRYVATKPIAETNMHDLIEMMIGRELRDLFRKEDAPLGERLLDVSGLSVRRLLNEISLTVRKGEIVGLAGLVGAGRTELARAIFGDLAIDKGRIAVGGRQLGKGHSPRVAIAAGIGLVPEDRKEQGVVTDLSVRQNISLALLKRLSRLGVVNVGAERRLADRYVARLAIKTPSIDQKTLHLSGGNQQRVVIAKWLATEPKVLIVDEPTRGIDVGATAEIHARLSELAKQGMAILMISSDMAEILAMSDRILVMRQGRIEGELSRAEATQEKIMRLATGQPLRVA